nr:PREDICTED: methylated-DNA--protein-cysteine methyltransferase [Struthio camelus australis]
MIYGKDLPSTMASRFVPKATSKNGESQCKVMHAVLHSPVGKIEISGCETGLHEIKLPKMNMPPNRKESSIVCLKSDGNREGPRPLYRCSGWLSFYFLDPGGWGRAAIPAVHYLFALRDSFTRQVLWTLLNDVKFGEAISYKQLAALAGNSKAARAVGGAMRSNPIPIIIPCHRVIRSSGETGNYGGGNLMKEWLLSHEKLQKEKLAY